MDNFEQYVQAKKTQQLDTFYEQKQDINLFKEKDYEYNHVSAEGIQDQFEERLNNTEYKDRVYYYFKDTKLLEAKANKYRRLSNDEDNVMTEYADKHEFRSARKRKNYSKDAAKAFTKAKDKEEELDERGMTNLEKFKAREEIMRLRMDGMVAAAKVKAKDKKNQEYRIGKAKFSCLTILKEQLEALLGEKEKYQADYEKIKERLDKEISKAEAALKKNTQSAGERWLETNGLNDEEVLEQKLNEAQKKNQDITKEGVIIREQLFSMKQESQRKEYTDALHACNENKIYIKNDKLNSLLEDGDQDRILMFACHYIKRDAKGRPINKDEKKKEDWNNTWLATVQDKTKEKERCRMIDQRIDEMLEMELPAPDLLEQKGVMYFYKKDPYGFQEMLHVAVCADEIVKVDKYAKYSIDYYPGLSKKLAAITKLGYIFNHNLKMNYAIDPNTVDLPYTSAAEAMATQEEWKTYHTEIMEEYRSLYKQAKTYEKVDNLLRNRKRKNEQSDD